MEPVRLGPVTISCRLIVGTGKCETYEIMQEALNASGAEVVTVAVRRERLLDSEGRSLLDFIDTDRYTILPNTAGCFTASDAVRVARLGRELLDQLGNSGKEWVKLEVLGDKKTLLPDPVGTLEACRELVADGFTVRCYTSDDPIMAARIRDAGATSVMPAGSHRLRSRDRQPRRDHDDPGAAQGPTAGRRPRLSRHRRRRRGNPQ
jgi:thiazole synthase